MIDCSADLCYNEFGMWIRPVNIDTDKKRIGKEVKTMDKSQVIKAHEFSMNHKEKLQKDTVCGCFHCLKIFSPDEIKKWINDPQKTALCPYCGIDSVIGSYSGFPITTEFLSEMKEYWF